MEMGDKMLSTNGRYATAAAPTGAIYSGSNSNAALLMQ